ncbi:MAG: hypothetical protein GY839_20225, partial [candidate division Zixibacteria bacterium]|nr:hypothetical protein [candidate division Zixibacteria bacterium]
MKLIFIFIVSLIIFHPFALKAETYVRNIDIIRLNVFDNQTEHDGNFIYRLGNKFHVITKEHVIRRELLFGLGDSFDKENLDQSIRNIRALPFIGEVLFDINQAGADSIDIKITTEDLWTTIFGVSSEGGGGLYKLSVYADEKNIAGLG